MTSYFLNFMGTTLLVEVEEEAVPIFEPVRSFFSQLIASWPANEPTFHLSICRLLPGQAPASEAEPVTIRRSNAQPFNLQARRRREGDRWVYVNDSTLLEVPVRVEADNHFRAHVSSQSTVQLIDFIRDLITRHEEDRGTVILHAAAVYDGSRVLAIAGVKGSGKTTTLLSWLRLPGWRYFSGDKIFCELVNGEIQARPWRDYPYLGVGTIRADPRLTTLVREQIDPDLAGREDTHKVLIHPDQFESWLDIQFCPEPHSLAGILLPEVRPGEPLRMTHLDDEGERWAVANQILDRTVDTTFFTWQSYLVPDYRRLYANLSAMREPLSKLLMVRLKGTLDLDPETIAAITAPSWRDDATGPPISPLVG